MQVTSDSYGFTGRGLEECSPISCLPHQAQYKPAYETRPSSLRRKNGLTQPKFIRHWLNHFMRFTVYSLPFLLKFRTCEKNSLPIKFKYHPHLLLHSSTEKVLQGLQIQHNIYLLINIPYGNCKFSYKLLDNATRHLVKAYSYMNFSTFIPLTFKLVYQF